jgi:hypothetical protein
MDRRVDPRVEVRLRCHVDLPASKLSLFVGMTVNMSRSGILLAWDTQGLVSRPPEAGDLVSVDIELPENHSFGRRCMYCQASVVRVTAGEHGVAMVALQVNQMQFRSYDHREHGRVPEPNEARCSVM